MDSWDVTCCSGGPTVNCKSVIIVIKFMKQNRTELNGPVMMTNYNLQVILKMLLLAVLLRQQV